MEYHLELFTNHRMLQLHVELPVVAVRTLERFLWVVDSQMPLEVSFAREFLRAHRTLKQDFCWHVHHFYVHLQDVLILKATKH